MQELDERSVSEPTLGTLAFLFTDIAGSTQLWERLPEAMTVALARHDTILRAAVEASGGRVVKTTGDGLMAVFPTATAGVAASLAAQLALGAEAWQETGSLRVRMGLHAGDAERRGDDYFGPTINRTARIMAAGHGGQILLSASGRRTGRRRAARPGDPPGPRGASAQGPRPSRARLPAAAPGARDGLPAPHDERPRDVEPAHPGRRRSWDVSASWPRSRDDSTTRPSAS